MDFKHIIMTRVNLPGRTHRPKRLTDEWIRGRCDTYENLAIPSFMGQTEQNFEVVALFCGVYTPPDVVERVKGWEETYGGKIHPVFIPERSASPPPLGACRAYPLDKMGEAPKNAILPYLNGEDYVITSVCDSDDCFNMNFVERTQAEAKEKNEVLLFTEGALLDMPHNMVYWQGDGNRHHMYPSLVERADDIKTVLYRKMPRMYQVAPVRFLEVDYPYFLRGVNGTNVMTVIHPQGRERVSGRKGFPFSELEQFTLPKEVDWL